MLRWMCGENRRDKIRNDDIREIVRVASIVEKMVETRLVGRSDRGDSNH